MTAYTIDELPQKPKPKTSDVIFLAFRNLLYGLWFFLIGVLSVAGGGLVGIQKQFGDDQMKAFVDDPVSQAFIDGIASTALPASIIVYLLITIFHIIRLYKSTGRN